jgi:cardiolipin synthase
VVSEVAHAFGWAFAIWGTALYWWAGVLYVVQVRQLVRADRVTTEPAAP